MKKLVHSSESEHLLSNTCLYTECSRPIQQTSVRRCPSPKHLCLPSRSAVLILAWTAIVGIIHFLFMIMSAAFVVSSPQPKTIISMYVPLPFASLSFVMVFYPLSGFTADVCCGRLKAVVVSLLILLVTALLVLGLSVVAVISHPSDFFVNQSILIVVLETLSLLTFVVGMAGYQANFIQLGLDQLFEAPSQYLGIFIHYATWVFNSGTLLILILPVFTCFKHKTTINMALLVVIVPIVMFILLLLVSYWKRRWFHGEPGYVNPYWTIYDIIKFVKKHKHPLRRSAFTFSDNYIPSRLDFAKERYGGPFTTEQVENVKTFLNILLVLFAVGPVFSMEVPASLLVFLLSSSHMIYHQSKNPCTFEEVEYMYVASGSMKSIAESVILFPVYIWIMFFCCVRKHQNYLCNLVLE